MKKILGLLLALLWCIPPGAASQRCASFTWVTDFDGAEKAAMVVNVTIGGQRVALQFDTGSDVSGLYGSEVASRLSAKEERFPSGHRGVSVDMSLEGIALGRQQLYLFSQLPGEVSGRLGLEALLGRIVKIDYPQQRICLLDSEEFESMLPELLLTPTRIRSKKLFLYTELNGDYWPGLFFDSGASLYEVLVDRAVWQTLTGRTGTERNNRYLQGWSRNQLVTTVGAPLQGKMSLAGVPLPAPTIHFNRTWPNHFSDYPIDALGLVGNAPFFKRVIVMDLRGGETWFGVVKK